MARIIFAAIVLAEALACSRILPAQNVTSPSSGAAALRDYSDSGVGCVMNCIEPVEVK